MKNVLHLQIPTDKKNGSNIYSMEFISRFLKYVEIKLGDEWTVIVSPFSASVLNKKGFKNFNVGELSKDEIMKMIDGEEK